MPKVLVIGINAWRTEGTTHTLMDIFSNWDADKLALIYTRSDFPNTSVCNHFFQISEAQVLKSVFKPWMKVGRVVSNQLVDKYDKDVCTEHRRYSLAHKKKSSLLPLLREVVWKLGKWKSTSLKKFVLDFNPDIIFIPIYPTVYMGRIQQYIAKLTGKPTVCYLADDNYSYDACQSVCDYIHRFWLRKKVAPLAKNCKEMFVIVDKEKEETDKLFGTNSTILTKSIDFSNLKYKYKKPNTPLKFVYTGSLIIGRDKTIALLANSINDLNKNGIKAELYIYSQTTPTDTILKQINSGSSHFCGKVDRKKTLEIIREADVVVFAEALEGKSANVARLSFSTKITDYLSCGKCILAIGNDYIAPIDYLQRNDAAIIAHNSQEIREKTCDIINNPSLLDTYGQKAFSCAVKNHDKQLVSQRFISTMLKAID